MGRFNKRKLSRDSKRRNRGFTLIELMIVISILLILISIAVPQYSNSIKRARESVLRQDLFTIRSVISQYTLDKQKMPQSGDDLVQAGYLKQVPVDPMTGQSNWNWHNADEGTIMSPDEQDEGGIDDVFSSSNDVGTDGVPYSQY
ncbi:MAG TPA: prepilin-type N-terminal cleavage/methylation domain-containing protein [Terriglobales bacterium]|nr:prepilin-type N-terminal cleavage/methylation domain-containing protein [Terriglobales bacterium]